MQKHIYQSHEYYIHGSNPRILLLSGMHGNEYESGVLLEQYLIENIDTIPNFLYIPKVSPSAVAAKTRKNRYGHDINRQFLPHTKDSEALAVMEIVKPYRFDTCIDIHEDPDRTLGFYLYDTETMTPEELDTYRSAVHTTGARLYTGIDDLDDEHLMLHVDKGYVCEPTAADSGFSSRWLFDMHIVLRSFTIEIPGKGTKELKRSLVHAVIPFLFSMKGITV